MKSLAIVIDGSPNDEASLASAVALCQRLGARLTVVHPHQPEVVAAGSFEVVATVIDNSPAVREAAERARSAYKAATAGVAGARLVELSPESGDVMERVALYHDLVLLERLDELDRPDLMLLNAALWSVRIPVLVVPPTPLSAEPKTVAIAWNATPQAAHALRAAVPFLQTASRVVVLTRQGVEQDEELMAYLGAVGVTNVEWRPFGDKGLSARGWGRALLAETGACSADMLVMGAFGTSLSNLLGFGRTTEKICSAAKVPVLLHA